MRWSLKKLIHVVTILAIFLTFVISATVGYRVTKQNLIDSTLDTNRAYAEKLASTTDVYLRETLQILQVNSEEVLAVIEQPNAESQLNKIVERIRMQTQTFNSISVVSSEGIVKGVSPQSLNLNGEKRKFWETIFMIRDLLFM